MIDGKPWRDKDTLVRLYHENELSMQETADELGCAIATIQRWFDNHNIQARNVRLDEDHPLKNKELLRKEYVEKGKSSVELSREWDCSKKSVLLYLRKHGIPTRTENKHKPVPFYTDNRGYERWMNQYGDSYNSIYVHQLLAIAEYGIEAVKDNVVHHKNNVPWDSRPDNLMVISNSEHATSHLLGEFPSLSGKVLNSDGELYL